VLPHQPLHSLLAHANALSPQLPPDARPAVGPTIAAYTARMWTNRASSLRCRRRSIFLRRARCSW
jgi:hypothetical protein